MNGFQPVTSPVFASSGGGVFVIGLPVPSGRNRICVYPVPLPFNHNFIKACGEVGSRLLPFFRHNTIELVILDPSRYR